MKKAILVGFLLVFAWTSVVGAEEQEGAATTQAPSPSAFNKFLLAEPKPADKNYIAALDGYDWAWWPQNVKNAFVQGFVAAANLVAAYGMKLIEEQIPLAQDPIGAYLWTLEARGQLLGAGGFRFRSGVYVIELDVLYSDWANRPISIIDAIYIANARLEGWEVDLATWRAKASPGSGT